MRRYLWIATALSFCGVMFAGYLSSVKWMSGVCAFNETCPLFLGHPACYTGFSLFCVLFIISAASVTKKIKSAWPAILNTTVSALGVLFAGRMVIAEVSSPAQFFQYGMGLPTCAYGLVFFAAMLIASVVAWNKHATKRRGPLDDQIAISP